MTKHVVSKERQARIDALGAEQREKVANPVAKLVAYILADAEVDADRLQNKLFVGVQDAAGEPITSGVFIDYRVIEDNGTGSTFVLDGVPIGSSFGVAVEGLAFAEDPLLTGKNPGTFIVRATAPGSADPAQVFADFRITVSSRVPTALRIVSRGESSVPIGELVGVQATVELLDQDGKPITFGAIQTQLHDPNHTGSLLIYGGRVVSYIQQSTTPGGIALQGELDVGDDAPGQEFYLRVNRVGREPHIDIPYKGVPKKSSKS